MPGQFLLGVGLAIVFFRIVALTGYFFEQKLTLLKAFNSVVLWPKKGVREYCRNKTEGARDKFFSCEISLSWHSHRHGWICVCDPGSKNIFTGRYYQLDLRCYVSYSFFNKPVFYEKRTFYR